MNHIYRIVFNRALGLMQVVCELARAGGKTAVAGGVGGDTDASPSSQRAVRRVNLRCSSLGIILLGLIIGNPAMAASIESGGGNGGSSVGGTSLGGVAGGGGGQGLGVRDDVSLTSEPGTGGSGANVGTPASAGVSGNATNGTGGAAGGTDLTAGGGGGGGGDAGSLWSGSAHGGQGGDGTVDGETIVTISGNVTGRSGTGITETTGGGGGGGGGLVATSDATITNDFNITGGAGGEVTIQLDSAPNFYSASGGGGGAGLVLMTGGTITNNQQITGGAGGASPFGYAGSGGAGVFLYSGGTLFNSVGGTITGGATGGSFANAGAGVLSNDGEIANSGTISGGAGNGTGIVANGGSIINNAGATITGGTVGGVGVSLGYDGSATLTNSGIITGGNGTNSIGVQINSTNNSLTNSGTITGGSSANNTGILISGDDNTLVNTGTINGAGGGNAVRVSGNSNTVEFDAGSVLTDSIVSTGTDNILELGGDDNETLNVTTTQLSGFAQYLKTGASTWTLTGATSATTPWTISAGTLSIGADGNLGAAPIATDASIGALTFNGGTLQTTNTAPMTSARAITLNDGGGTFDTETNDTVATALTLSGNITGDGGLTKKGTGTLTLSGVNEYHGETIIDAGVLSIAADISLGATDSVLTFNGGTLQTANVGGGIIFTRTITLNSGGGTFDTESDTIEGPKATNLTLNSIIAGEGSLTKTGIGTLTLNSINAYSGGTAINAGMLIISADDNLGATTGALTFNGGALQNAAEMTSNRNIILSEKGGIIDTPNALTLGGDISGDGDLTKTNEGALVLSGDNTYVGQTLINAGTLQAGAEDVLADSSAIDVNSDATLDLDGHNQSIHNLTGAGTVAMPDATLTIDPNTADTFDGQFTGSGDLVKTGTNTLILTNNESQLNNITVQAGTLDLAHTGNLTVNGNYTTENNATTILGTAAGELLTVAKTFAQGGAGSVLEVSIDPLNQPLIIADAAVLAGSLVVTGLSDSGAAAVTASELTGAGYTLIKTTGGITGDFANNPSTLADADYLLLKGTKVGNDYILGIKLAWTDGDATTATGTFTLGPDQKFNVDTELMDRTGLTGGWNGTTLTKDGDGLLILSDNNSYTGGTIINAGTLSISSDANLGNASGALTINGGTLETTGTFASTRPLIVNAAGTLMVDDGTLTTLGGNLSGTGPLTKTGGGTLTLSGDNQAFTGGIDLTAGQMNVNGAMGGPVAVQSTAILGGSGSIGALTVAAGGTVSPGNSIGTLTVDGDAAFAIGSVYHVQINAAGESDLLKVSGKATLAGGTVNVESAPGDYAAIDRYTILTADGGVTGEFSTLTADFEFLAPTLTYDADNVYLQLTRNNVNFDNVATNNNQTAVADAAQSLGAGNGLYDALAGLPDDAATVRHALNQISGELNASVNAALIEDSHFVRDAANDRLRASFNEMGASGQTVMTYDRNGVARYADPATEDAAFWGQIYGAKGSQDGNNNAASMSRDSHGVILGGDAPAGNWRLGALLGLGRSTFDIGARNSSGDSDNYSFGMYAGTEAAIEQHTLALRSGLIYSRNNIDTSRSVNFPGFSDRLNGDYSAHSLQGFGEVAYPLTLNTVAIEPFDNLAVINVSTDDFTEHGAQAALQVAGDSSTTTFNTLGIRAAHQFKAGKAQLTANGMLGWRHAFGSNTPTVDQNFVGGSDFTIAGTPIAENAAVITVGLDMAIAKQGTVGLAYQGQLGNASHENGVQANFAWKF